MPFSFRLLARPVEAFGPQSSSRRLLASLVFAVLFSLPLQAQWNPSAGQWGKQDSVDVRLMTWNVQDGLCSTNAKIEGQNNWSALARIVAAFEPDVLLLQECGDNSGNGTGGSVDSVSTLSSVMDRFVNGGTDSWNGGSVTAYVAKYAPGYSLPFVYVTSNTDNFNRNVILSRFPFADLNGDGKTTLSDIPNINSDAYAPGGDGGLRGVQFVEIDLPNGTYLGDLVVANAHLKAGSQSSSHDQRIEAAQNVAYFIDYGLNGAGTGSPDPAGRISDNPQMTSILPADTPVILGGDWNEDESSNGTKGPAEWLARAELTGGSDGTDRDRSDMALDNAQDAFNGSVATLGSVKFDYFAWQDSICSPRLQFVFSSNAVLGSLLPPAVAGFPNPAATTTVASDHRPVIVDFILPVGCPQTSTYCVLSPNSFGSGAILLWTGSQSVAQNNFSIGVQSSAPSQFGIFYYGSTQVQVPFGDGFRCVGGGASGTFRFSPAQQSDIFGDLSRFVDMTQSPAGAGAGQIHAGSTWNFQYWYRDPAAGGTGFNLSNGLSVPFCP